VTAAASPTVVLLGARLTVFITAALDAGVEVNLPDPVDLGSSFEVIRRVSQDRVAGDGSRTREWQLEVIAWEIGDLVIPPVAVTYTAFGRADQVHANALKVRVTGLLGDVVDDPRAMRDHAPPTDLMRRDWRWLWAAGAVSGLLAIAMVGRARARRRRRRSSDLLGGVASPLAHIDGPSARALERLLTIERSGALDRDPERRAGYTQMVDVIRDYLAARYRVTAADQTTSEVLARLTAIVTGPTFDGWASWLERCDVVKYGGLRPEAPDARTTLADARALVVATTPGSSPGAPPTSEDRVGVAEALGHGGHPER
jgi:hypothetical protein